MTPLEQKIHTELNLESNPIDISIIDSIKIYYDFLNEQKIMKIFNNTELTVVEQYMKKYLLNPYHLDYLYINQTYYSNLIGDLYFIINNPFMFDTKKFKNIADNIEWLNKIPYIIETCLTKTYESNLRNFSNEYLFRKWKDMKYTKLNNTNQLYQKIWFAFEKIIEQVKQIINKFYDLYKLLHHIPGCINISKEFYCFCAEINTTLPFNHKMIKDTLSMAIK